MPPPPAPPEKKRGLGCLGCGCALLALLAILLAGLVGAGGYYLVHLLGGYTDTTAVAVLQFDGGDPLFQAAHQKLVSFQEALERGRPASLHLTADEINTLVARDPAFAQSKGRRFFAIKGDRMTVQTSLRLGQVESFIWPDRYLNGDVTFGLHFDPDDKSLHFDLHGLHLKQRDLSAGLDDDFNKSISPFVNREIQSNPAAHDFLERARKITVENGELVIETR